MTVPSIKLYRLKYILLFVGFLLCFNVSADDFPNRPNPPRLVNDLAGVFTPEQIQRLEHDLVLFNDETSTQVAVVIVPDLYGYDAGDYSFRLAENWGIGQKGKNNGILVLVKPKVADSRGQAFIAVGYGLEGVVTDAAARRIVDNEMIPYFKEDNYFGGVLAGVEVIKQLSYGEYTADSYMAEAQESLFAGFIVLLIFIFVIFSIQRKALKAKKSSLGSDLPLWMIFAMMNSGSGRGSSSGQWGNFSSGKGGFGGGGSFRGFGGGGFGGGGAGGSW